MMHVCNIVCVSTLASRCCGRHVCCRAAHCRWRKAARKLTCRWTWPRSCWSATSNACRSSSSSRACHCSPRRSSSSSWCSSAAWSGGRSWWCSHRWGILGAGWSDGGLLGLVMHPVISCQTGEASHLWTSDGLLTLVVVHVWSTGVEALCAALLRAAVRGAGIVLASGTVDAMLLQSLVHAIVCAVLCCFARH
jgi:hypothetical protein